jgi:glycerol kinase
MKNYLAIDQGTTSSRSIIFDSDLNSIKDSQKAYELSYPKDGWVEAEPWRNSKYRSCNNKGCY